MRLLLLSFALVTTLLLRQFLIGAPPQPSGEPVAPPKEIQLGGIYRASGSHDDGEYAAVVLIQSRPDGKAGYIFRWVPLDMGAPMTVGVALREGNLVTVSFRRVDDGPGIGVALLRVTRDANGNPALEGTWATGKTAQGKEKLTWLGK